MHSGLFSQLVKWVRQVLVESLRQVSYDFQLHSPKRCLETDFLHGIFFQNMQLVNLLRNRKWKL